MKIRIDHTDIEVMPGVTVMEAASSSGIDIPSMCFMKGHSNHPSCMICIVEDENTGNLFPSCAMPVSDGMKVLTGTEQVLTARREALELLLSDHRGDCDAPCRVSCPAFMNIPLMNRLLAEGKRAEALKIVRLEIAIPLVLGYICPAPCEKACHRKSVDTAISICSLKLYSAQDEGYLHDLPLPEKKTGKRVAVIGSGPAGLSAAFYILKHGHDCNIFDRNSIPGGTLLNIERNKLPLIAIEKEAEVIREMGGRFSMNEDIDNSRLMNLAQEFDAVVIAAGHTHDFDSEFQEKIFSCISKDEMMAVRSAAKGKETAEKVNSFLISEPVIPERIHFNSHTGKLSSEDITEYLKECGETDHTLDKIAAEASRCMHCDCRKPHSCKLRHYATVYGAKRRHFSSGERKEIRKELQHDLVVYEPQKCIRCGLCVDIVSKEPSAAGMAFFGRGFDIEIGFALGSSFREALGPVAGKCVEACPTGALSFKKDI